MSYKTKPIILAICGKSASGKDTLAQFLTNFLKAEDIPVHNIVSVTTRPKREKEIGDKSYYFLNEEQFKYLRNNGKLVEHTKFRGWYYGIPYNEIKEDRLNIGVFNPKGLENLKQHNLDYKIIPIYLEEKFLLRMRRSRDREGRWRLEYFRRALVDFFAFIGIKKKIRTLNNGKYIVLKDSRGVWYQSRDIKYNLIRWGILIEETEQKVRLGNFV